MQPFSPEVLAFTFGKCCSRTLPVGWDDPSDSAELLQILADMFHQAARGTATKDTEVPLTVPLITINQDKLKGVLR